MDALNVAMMDDVAISGGEGEEEGEWRPIGERCPSTSSSHGSEIERMRMLEEEQEQLNASLLALTTHFAQVQFRLQQIGKATSDDKERLLADLEEFAFKACPDVLAVVKEERARRRSSAEGDAEHMSEAEHSALVKAQSHRQLQLIAQLKDQLADLERCAYEAGEGSLPSNVVMEKQRTIIEQLRERIELDVDGFDEMEPLELQRSVDAAVRRLVNPIRAKDQVITQLKTQITDLERFVEFLQLESNAKCTCEHDKEKCVVHSPSARLAQVNAAKALGYNQAEGRQGGGVIDSSLAIVQMYLLSQMGCASRRGKRSNFHKNELKATLKGNHWGDLRAAFELAVDHLITVSSSPSTGDRAGEEDNVFAECPEQIVTAVRKYVCPSLRDLLQHGMFVRPGGPSSSSSLLCISARRPPSSSPSSTHAWDVIYAYFEMKHGREFSDAPVRKLTQSFQLDNVGGRVVTSRQALLTAVDSIVTSHTKLRRSADCMFKAFVCAALNERKLVPWLRMILRTREIVDENYLPWSYVARTSAEDALLLLERLNEFEFHLPVDLAVRHFNRAKDAF